MKCSLFRFKYKVYSFRIHNSFFLNYSGIHLRKKFQDAYCSIFIMHNNKTREHTSDWYEILLLTIQYYGKQMVLNIINVGT